MSFSLIADHICETIFDIDPSELARKGITLLLADLDNTLVPYGVPVATEQVRKWKDELNRCGITLFVLSNNRHTNRPRIFCEDLDVPYIGHAGKPGTGSFIKAMEQMGAALEQTALVGDQVFTDVLGANRAGVMSILVAPIRLAGNPGRYLRYWAEWPFRVMAKHCGKAVR